MTPSAKRPWLLAVYGPTGSGKSWLAEAVADRTGARLANADAFQVYRGLDIGTAKPVDKSRYALLDLVGPEEEFSVVQWVTAAQDVLAQAWADQADVVLVGGTGFYLRALTEQYTDLGAAPDPALRQELAATALPELVARLRELDPDAAAQTDLANPVRVRRAIERALSPAPPLRVTLPPFHVLKVATWPEGDWHGQKLRERVDAMWSAGWPDEVKGLLEQGVGPTAPGLRAIGYHTVIEHLRGLVPEQDAKESIAMATRQYAKRQKTWLRSEPRLAYLNLHSGDPSELSGTLASVCLRLESLESKKTNG
ncbi:MAG: tRNA (adenosine(37)-N6)-dimethylallyltransferase MiaA [Fimbriimonadaceae bacterium]|nr:tRNA (adenosine(37)-N6)-dimethylallyltransferase MiaA [Fimbriimonadaceae bacterium]